MSTEAVKCVLLADRHHGLSEGIRGLLESELEAVVMVADETSLIESAAKLRPASWLPTSRWRGAKVLAGCGGC
jgi:hypothetical protein